MSMFDYYRPADEAQCPACRHALHEWQGKDGPNALFVWVQGKGTPVDQLVDEEVQLPLAQRSALALPLRFVIYSHDCPEHQPVEADCGTVDGVWTSTRVRSLQVTESSRVR